MPTVMKTFRNMRTDELVALIDSYEQRMQDSAEALSVPTAKAICGIIRAATQELRIRHATSH